MYFFNKTRLSSMKLLNVTSFQFLKRKHFFNKLKSISFSFNKLLSRLSSTLDSKPRLLESNGLALLSLKKFNMFMLLLFDWLRFKFFLNSSNSSNSFNAFIFDSLCACCILVFISSCLQELCAVLLN